MAFLISHSALTPRSLPGRIDPGARIVRAGELEALGDAQALVEAARRRADDIVAGAQAAFEAERERGHAEGRAQAQAEAAERMLEAVGRTITYFAGVEASIIDLVMQSMRKLIAGYDSRDQVEMVVRGALSVVRNQKQVTLRLHPDDVGAAQARLNDWLADFPRMGCVDVVDDARLERGACIVESDIGLVEASMESQLAAMRKAFDRVLGSRI